ncbi:MAG TPA: carboxyl transferase domain-containing protein, partial [Magnetospirillaceae bacterium]|nr:carboxyl transferase domain-containing protein [Magnetospirillaceae bacterium]
MTSWYEASARQRIDALADPNSFEEFIGPEQREISPHLSLFDLPEQFDDGIVVGRAKLAGKPVLLAAQEGRFMGGAFGEVHGAKLTG